MANSMARLILINPWTFVFRNRALRVFNRNLRAQNKFYHRRYHFDNDALSLQHVSTYIGNIASTCVFLLSVYLTKPGS